MADRERQDVSERIEELFDEASELPPERRAEYLDSRLNPSSEADMQIRVRVERLLYEHDRCGILDLQLIESIPEPESPCPALEPGELISDRFRINRMIGSGGMGEVYEAEDLVIGQKIALKTIRVEMAADASQAMRFRRELLICRNLTHRNVCKVYEYNEIDRGARGRLHIFTMELLRGETLAQRLACKGRLDPSAAIAILEQVSAGLEEVHRSGIIHRDLKPSNVFLVREFDGSDRAVVMDFGLARDVTRDDLRQTRTGMVMGTRLYMAPEAAESVGIFTDVYSFAVLALEMVTGSASPLVAPRSRAPSLDPAWDRALLPCFNLDPAARPASTSEVVGMLRTRTRAWWKLWVAAGMAIVCATAGGVLWRSIFPPPAPAPATTTLTQDAGLSTNPTASADGKLMAYTSDRKSPGDLNIWVLDTEKQAEPRQITNDPYDEDEATISRNGRMIAWRSLRDDTLYIRDVAGGPIRTLARPAFTPRFSPDGSYIAYWTGVDGQRSAPARAWLAPVAGGPSRDIAPGFADARLPAWSPDGKSVLFRGSRSPALKLDAIRDWWIASLDGKSIRPTGVGDRLRAASLVYHESPVVWEGSRIIFPARSGDANTLWSIGFSSLLNSAFGAPHQVTSGGELQDSPAILSNGRIAYSDWHESIRLFRLDISTGVATELNTDKKTLDTRVSSSSDGRTLVFGRRKGNDRNVFTKDLRTGEEAELYPNEFVVPWISPDGRTAAISTESGVIRLIDLASKRKTREYEDCGELRGWTPDSKQVLYLLRKVGAPSEVSLLDLATGLRTRVLADASVEEAAIAGDGTTMAFTIRKEGVYSIIYVARLTANGVTGQWAAVTSDAGWADKPVWSPDGKRLYFRARIDGFQCIWSQGLDPQHLTLKGDPRPVGHFHRASSTISLYHLSPTVFSLALGGGSLFLTVSESDSSIRAVQFRP